MKQASSLSNPAPAVRIVCCPACGSEVDELRKTPITHEVRGVPVDVFRLHRVCPNCGTDFENTLDPDWHLDAFAKYRAKMGYVTPEQIRQWRASKGLTQGEVGELLGFGEATLGRYEKGSLQTAANNAALARIMTAAGLIDAIDEKPDAISSEKRHRLISENAAESADSAARTLLMNTYARNVGQEFNGGRDVVFERVASFIRKIAHEGKSKTVVNKLMFYSDFLAYREHGQSISGLCYARLPYGPVPNDYNSLFGVLAAVKFISIEPRPAGEFMSDVIRCGERAIMAYDFGADESIIKYVCTKFAGYSAKSISDYSHEERAWIDVAPCSLISYHYAQYLRV